MAFDDFEILEDTGEGYGNKNTITYQEIVMKQLSRITGIQSQEMREGFWKVLPVRVGGTATTTQKIWIADTRKEFISAIQCFYDLLLTMFDETMREDANAIEKKLDEQKKKFADEGKPETKFVEFERQQHRLLFQKLNLLIGRMGFFEEGVGET